MAVNLQDKTKIVSVIPLFLNMKRSNEIKINRPKASPIIMFWCCLSRLGKYTVMCCLVDPVVDCPSKVDYILERNLMNCQSTKNDVSNLNSHTLSNSVSG